MPNETSQVTIINPRPSKPPSLWMNMLTLIFLFGLIVGAKQLSDKWLSKAPPPEAEENQIVMEDLESEKPLAESTTVEMPEVEGVKEIPPSEKIAPGTSHPPSLTLAPPTRATPKPATARRELRRAGIVHRTNKSPYAEPDPYTDGGPLDLDRRENQKSQPAKTSVPREAAATPVPPPAPLNERDRFIPFESK